MDQIKELSEILELLESKQYTVLRQRLSEMNEADIAVLNADAQKSMLGEGSRQSRSRRKTVLTYLENKL